MIYLMGASLGTGNRGVSALGASLVKLFDRGHPGHDVGMILGQKSAESFRLRVHKKARQIHVLNYRRSVRAPGKHLFIWLLMSLAYRLIPVRAWRGMLAARCTFVRSVLNAEIVGDIRGGDSFSDIYGLGNFIWGSLPVIAVLLVRRNIVMLPQTYGPFKSRLARGVARFILRRSSTILCRDRESPATVKSLAGEHAPVSFCPDVAFCLDAIPPKIISISPPFRKTAERCLGGLNVSGLLYHGGYNRANMFGLKMDYCRFVQHLVEAFLADPLNDLLLVPHTFAAPGRVESDPDACRSVRALAPAHLRDRIHLLEGEYDQNEIKGIIGICDFFVGSRMHACIAALSQAIPTIGVAYSKKFKGVFETVGAASWVIDARAVSVEQAIARVLELLKNRATIASGLANNVQQAQNELESTFQRIATAAAPNERSKASAAIPAREPHAVSSR
jgi:colanic acid/amylovoran biosynthesis protein